MKKLLCSLLIIPSIAVADPTTTNNQLPQQFFNNNQQHNEWTCTDPTHNHGNNIGAMVNGDHMMHPGVSLADDVNMTEAQIQNGWSSELGADIWHWNTSTSTTTMKQTITDSEGNVTTQIREVELGSCGYTNCGGYNTYTDTHVQGSNSATDFQIAVRFDFEESTNRTSHWAVDIKNPTLKITYEQNPVVVSQTTVTQLEEASDAIEDAIEMLDNQEIGGTTFTNMVENIIEDSGIDMTLVFEAEMDMEEQMYFDETIEVDSMEQTIDDEMAGVIIMEIPTEMEFEEPEMEIETVDMDMPMDMPDMEMEEPSFTDMASDTFTNAMDTLSDMFNMDMPEGMSEEVATEMLDAMVEMDLPMDMPMEMPEDAPVMEEPEMEITEDMPTMEEAPIETVAMNEEPEMERPEMESEMEAPTPEPTMEEESTPTAEVEEEAPTPTENEPTGGTAPTPTEESTETESEPTPTESAPTPTEEPTESESTPTEETPTTSEEPTETESEPTPTEETPTESEETSTSEDTPTETEDSQTVESDEETTVAEADTDSSVSETSDTIVSTEVQSIGDKVKKIIANLNAKLKKVSDRVMAVQIVTLKGMQMDGPKLTSYQKKNFYKDRKLNDGNPDFFQNINTLAQQPIYVNVALTSYQNNDPLNKQRKVQNEINYEKNKLILEIRKLRGQ